MVSIAGSIKVSVKDAQVYSNLLHDQKCDYQTY